MKIEEEIQQNAFRSEYQKLLINILYTANWLESHVAKKIKAHGISIQQFNVLRILRGQYPDPATISLIQQRMLDKQSNASRLVEKLRLKGLVTRNPDPRDRRVMKVTITEAGLELLEVLDEVEKEFDKLFRNLTLSEAQQLNALLDKIRGNH